MKNSSEADAQKVAACLSGNSQGQIGVGEMERALVFGGKSAF